MTDFKLAAEAMKDEIVENRRAIHAIAELALDMPKTVQYVYDKLVEYGYQPEKCGKAGVTCVAGQGGKVMLLRADMDALPMQEATGLPYAATNGNCHSCGHDMHTAMLLGAAKLLKEHESELKGRVKFMFQPGEEVLGGAADMVAAGVLENPHVDCALGIHTQSGRPDAFAEVGNISFKKNYSTFSGDFIKVTVHGHQAHGAMPETGVDAINVGAHIVTALEELISREVSNEERSIVLVGKIYGGDSCNTEAGTCVLEVSVRAASAERRAFLKQRVKEISEGLALTFRATAEVEFVYGMPPMYNHPDMTSCVPGYLEELFGKEHVLESLEYGGTEDFTAVAEKVPSIYLNVGSGNLAGADVSHHNPHILFDENVLPIGTAAYVHTAVRYLEEHC